MSWEEMILGKKRTTTNSRRDWSLPPENQADRDRLQIDIILTFGEISIPHPLVSHVRETGGAPRFCWKMSEDTVKVGQEIRILEETVPVH